MAITQADELLRPQASSEYLLERYGIRQSPKSLAKARCYGTGPRFRKASRDVVYARASLDAWAQGRLSPKDFASTVEASAAAAELADA